MTAALSATAQADWDHTYGDADPLDYSEFMQVVTTPEGGALIVGIYAGDFEGLSAGLSYRPFAQYRDANGAEQWTDDLAQSDSCGGPELPRFSNMVIDNQGVAYLQSEACGQGGLVVLDSDGVVTVDAEERHHSEIRDNDRLAVVPAGGIQLRDDQTNTLTRFDSALQELWSQPIPEELAPDGGRYSSNRRSSLVAADGSGWVIGTIPKPIAHLTDALGLVKVSPDGSDTTTIKHFGIQCDRALKATADEIWLACNPDDSADAVFVHYQILAFDAVDGHLVGEVSYPGIEMPFVDEDGNADPTELTVLGRAVGNESFRFSSDGSIASVTLEGTEHFWRVTGSLDTAAWQYLDLDLESASRSINGSDSLGSSSIVLVGSEGEGASAGALQTARLGDSPRAFITRLSLPDVSTLVPTRFYETRPAPDGTADDRQEATGRRQAGQTTVVNIAGRNNIPTDAAAAIINVTAIGPDGQGFATAYPCDQDRPAASMLNYAPGQTIANGATIELDGEGDICIYTHRAMDLIVDVTGYLPANTTVSTLIPGRLYETRNTSEGTADGRQQATGRRAAGQTTVVNIAGRNNIPTDAAAAIINVTAIGPDAQGFATAYPCDQDRPAASMLNYAPGQTIANGATIELDNDGDICVYTHRAMDLIVDVTGYLPANTTVHTLVPARLYETRPAPNGTVDDLQEAMGRRWANHAIPVNIAGRYGVPSTATAAIINVTAISPDAQGFATAYPCDKPRPQASMLNYAAGQTVANGATVQLDPNGDICVYTHRRMDLIVDITGYLE